jgi:hypothetical protein
MEDLKKTDKKDDLNKTETKKGRDFSTVWHFVCFRYDFPEEAASKQKKLHRLASASKECRSAQTV